MAKLISLCGAVGVAICLAFAEPAASAKTVAPPLVLKATIALPNTRGRIDHMDIDLARKRLFVAEHDNGTLDVVDLVSRKVIKRISGLKKPQGVVFSPEADVLAVDCGGDGTVRLYSGKTYAPRGVIKLGVDADDARLDAANGDFVVAYGSYDNAGLAIVDPAKAEVIRKIPFPAHPEGFQISGDRAFANVPDAGQIDEVSLDSGRRIAKWIPQGLASNYPMALGDDGLIAIGFRKPDAFALFDRADGRLVARIAGCGDADDIWFDAKDQQYYMSCGSGEIEAFAVINGTLRSEGHVPTSWNDRTSLFVPKLDRFFLAVRATPPGSNASIRIYRPLR